MITTEEWVAFDDSQADGVSGSLMITTDWSEWPLDDHNSGVSGLWWSTTEEWVASWWSQQWSEWPLMITSRGVSGSWSKQGSEWLFDDHNRGVRSLVRSSWWSQQRKMSTLLMITAEGCKWLLMIKTEEWVAFDDHNRGVGGLLNDHNREMSSSLMITTEEWVTLDDHNVQRSEWLYDGHNRKVSELLIDQNSGMSGLWWSQADGVSGLDDHRQMEWLANDDQNKGDGWLDFDDHITYILRWFSKWAYLDTQSTNKSLDMNVSIS